MADNYDDGEFEPLFDYRRVQPSNYISLDDDEDEELKLIIKAKRLKTSNVVEKFDKDKLVVLDDDEEEDWLRSPPDISADRLKFGEDSTLKELRRKKQELVTITESESAQDVLKSIEDSHRKHSNSQNPALEDATEAHKPASERSKVVISIQDRDELKTFRFFLDEKLELLFNMYAKKCNLDAKKLVFSFDGDKISPSATPESLGMEDEDIIEVHEKS